MDSTEWDYPCPEIMGVPLSDMTTPGDTALHRLLMFSHLKRSNVHVPQDSLIGDAAEWFAAHPEPRICMMAWYYRACSAYDNGSYGDAVYYALNAEPWARELGDSLYLMRFYDIMGNCYGMAGDILQRVRYMEQAAELTLEMPGCSPDMATVFVERVFNDRMALAQPDSVVHQAYRLVQKCIDCGADARTTGRALKLYTGCATNAMQPDTAAVFGLIGRVARYTPQDASPLWRDSIESYMQSLKDGMVEDYYGVGRRMASDVVGAHMRFNEQAAEMRVAGELKRNTWELGIIGIVLLLIIVVSGLCVYRHAMMRRRVELECKQDELRLMALDFDRFKTETENRSSRLQLLSADLFRNRLDEVNALCDVYYNHRDMGDVGLRIFYREFEDKLAKLSSAETLQQLARIVNESRNGLLDRVKEELPDLKQTDLDILTYIYAGFDARAICLFTGITRENYYMKRHRLKKRIAASDAPHKDEFLDNLG